MKYSILDNEKLKKEFPKVFQHLLENEFILDGAESLDMPVNEKENLRSIIKQTVSPHIYNELNVENVVSKILCEVEFGGFVIVTLEQWLKAHQFVD